VEILRASARPERPSEQPVFYFDLADPHCYLTAERVLAALPVVPEWEPVLAADLARAAEPGETAREGIERRAAELGLQPIRWPRRWPPDSHEAMLAATYAKRIGRAVAFSLAAFRQEFAGGRDLGDRDTILIAGAACEIHPTALLKALGMDSIAAALEAASARALAAGVDSVPAVQTGDAVFQGDDVLERAASALGSRSAR
jgi:2-hydroxychromene-2-carboxylate isomerase